MHMVRTQVLQSETSRETLSGTILVQMVTKPVAVRSLIMYIIQTQVPQSVTSRVTSSATISSRIILIVFLFTQAQWAVRCLMIFTI